MTNPQPEPSMEEILASIRRIISEDEDDAAAKPAAAAPRPRAVAPAPAVQPPRAPAAQERPAPPAPAPVASRSADDDRAEPRLNTEDVEMIKQNVATNLAQDADAILADTTASAALKAFQNLSQSVRVSRGEGKTLEDLVLELLRPMVKDWLDANLPQIVEEKVEEEVQRIARRRT